MKKNILLYFTDIFIGFFTLNFFFHGGKNVSYVAYCFILRGQNLNQVCLGCDSVLA